VYNKIHFKFKKGAVPPYVPLEYVGCVGACDDTLKSVLQLPSRPVTGSTFFFYPKFTCVFQFVIICVICNYFSSCVIATAAAAAHNDAGIPVSQAPSRQRKPLTSQNGRNNVVPPSTRPFSTVAPRMAANRDTDQRGGQWEEQQSAGGQGGDNEVQCNCGQDARLQTVRKEGPNTGAKLSYV
jgi:DNA topoisomerase-3